MYKRLTPFFALAFFFGSFAAAFALSLPLDVPTNFVFTSALQVGSSGADVTNLQKILKNDGVYPEGLITGYFGNLTKKAVTVFQIKYKIDPVGSVGPKTRAKLNQLLFAVRGINSAANQTAPVAAGSQRRVSIDDLVGPSATPAERQDVQGAIDAVNLITQAGFLPGTTSSIKQLKQIEQQLNALFFQAPPTTSVNPPPTGQ